MEEIQYQLYHIVMYKFGTLFPFCNKIQLHTNYEDIQIAKFTENSENYIIFVLCLICVVTHFAITFPTTKLYSWKHKIMLWFIFSSCRSVRCCVLLFIINFVVTFFFFLNCSLIFKSGLL